MKFIRNHVIVYHNDNYNARLATKIILDHLHFREFKRDTCVRHGDYVIKLLKPSASLLLPDDDLEDQLHWFGVSFKITPWVGIMGN
ncbi:hypothetical protein D5b_00216 [Faustovirus]|nr:hypothetical protein D5b_00216 [Faustovirus]AMN84698.1 hypothetical protein D6_00295 [Faustovirus]AMP44170.1 hypothetical protein PRJ_Dakar_00214 [Faustovirus]